MGSFPYVIRVFVVRRLTARREYFFSVSALIINFIINKHNRWFESGGQHCGDVELAGYLANPADPVPLVLDRLSISVIPFTTISESDNR